MTNANMVIISKVMISSNIRVINKNSNGIVVSSK